MDEKNSTTCFIKSLFFVKEMVEEDMYKTIHEADFIKQFCDQIDTEMLSTDEHDFFNREIVFQKYPHLRNYAFKGFYNNLFASFKLFYEIDNILEHIIYEDMNLDRANDLMNYCSLLESTNINVMMSLDDEINFSRKYSIANSIYIIAKEIYDEIMMVHTTLIDDSDRNSLLPEDVIELTEYDESINRLNCKYIRNGMAVLKLFHILALIQVSPFYSDGVHELARKLIQELRDVLYDKRIMKFIVEQDTEGNSGETTRVKILFFMRNEDRYCIRLDLPHDDEKIHLNLNKPLNSKEAAFPFNGQYIDEALRICGDKSIFDNLFFKMDNMYWFKNDFKHKMKLIEKEDKYNGTNICENLEDFFHKRGHIQVLPSDQEDIKSVKIFSSALAEGLMQTGITDVYGATKLGNDEYYQYVMLQDIIFESIIILRNIEGNSKLGLKIGSKASGNCCDEIYSLVSDFIREKYSYDKKLISMTEMELDYCDFVAKCLDYLDDIISW